jgi:hypothetical protein
LTREEAVDSQAKLVEIYDENHPDAVLYRPTEVFDIETLTLMLKQRESN